jgi:hypothetical protein
MIEWGEFLVVLNRVQIYGAEVCSVFPLASYSPMHPIILWLNILSHGSSGEYMACL